ncbi:MAG: AgmX/PglI C-terminal domain-containing protein [Deltaproteobacteria bacterium]|nr:AgmX/PglI C-terminal domain-containing protein [Deltaproteobacteria bacterium]
MQSELRTSTFARSSIHQARTRRNRKIGLGLLIGLLAGNAIGLIVYRLLPARTPPAAITPLPALDDSESRAHRLAGLDAMEKGDYESAIKSLTAALRAPNASADLPQLLALAQNLLHRESARVEEEPAQSAPPPTPARSGRTEVPALPPPAPPPLLLVTTTPARLTIRVDGETRDMSPARLEVEPGPHVVTILRGDVVLVTRTVEAKAGRVVTVNVDVTDKLAPPVLVAAPTPDAAQAQTPDAGPVAVAAAAVADARTTPPIPSPEPLETRAVPGTKAPSPPKEEAPPPPKERIPASVVRQAMRASARYFKSCYDDELSRRPDLEGRVVLEVEVDEEGKVQRGRIVKSTFENQRVEYCIQRAASRVKFPAERGRPLTAVDFALSFRPED